MHNIYLIRRHFPRQASRIITVLVVIMVSALLVGVGVLLL